MTNETIVKSEIKISQSDMAKVAISAVEERLYSSKDRLTQAIKDADTRMGDLASERLEEISSEAKKAFSRDAAEVQKSLTKFFGPKKSGTLKATAQEVHYGGGLCDDGKMYLSCDITGVNVSSTRNVKMSSKVKDLTKEIERVQEQQKADAEELREVKKHIANMGRYERRAHARIVELSTKDDADTAAMLADLKSGLLGSDFLKSLPEGSDS